LFDRACIEVSVRLQNKTAVKDGRKDGQDRQCTYKKKVTMRGVCGTIVAE